MRSVELDVKMCCVLRHVVCYFGFIVDECFVRCGSLWMIDELGALCSGIWMVNEVLFWVVCKDAGNIEW